MARSRRWGALNKGAPWATPASSAPAAVPSERKADAGSSAACARRRRARSSKRKIRRLRQRVAGARRKYNGAVKRNPSIKAVQRSLDRTRRAGGYKIRPSQPRIPMTRRQRLRLLSLNKRLLKRCKTNSVQTAVTQSKNNDRVVIMPGRYTEPKSRDAADQRPACNPRCCRRTPAATPTPSYEYQATCPNDQNLIYVQGRASTGNAVAVAAASDRHGIPEQELGACIRCNLQIEGSGVKPEDVILDAGDETTRGTSATRSAKPGGYAKHVVLRADRADGFVGRNFLMQGALEFGFYTEETDGVLLDKTKFFWNADYGHLSFTTDHNLIQNCDGFGSGDAVVYPGAAPETGAQATVVLSRRAAQQHHGHDCDLRGSALGYSGSMGNAVRITNNHIYGNTTGIASDTLSAAGHPGFPADSSEIDNNFIYSNNLNLYRRRPAGQAAGDRADRHGHHLRRA